MKPVPTTKQLILNTVTLIPYGKVTNYGLIGILVGTAPRIVGNILTGLNSAESSKYPWHRVVNRDGFISSSKLGERGILQQELLKKEGVEVRDFQIINFHKKYEWKPSKVYEIDNN